MYSFFGSNIVPEKKCTEATKTLVQELSTSIIQWGTFQISF